MNTLIEKQTSFSQPANFASCTVTAMSYHLHFFFVGSYFIEYHIKWTSLCKQTNGPKMVMVNVRCLRCHSHDLPSLFLFQFYFIHLYFMFISCFLILLKYWYFKIYYKISRPGSLGIVFSIGLGVILNQFFKD